MQILIIEDDKFSANILIDLLRQNDVEAQITVADSLRESRQFIARKKFDLIFLDVHLGDGLGTNIINELPSDQQIIFITGDPNYALQAFEVNALDYLIKPLDKVRFKKTIQRLQERDEVERNIVIKADYQFYKVKADDILYVKSSGDYLTVVTEDESYTFFGRLKNFLLKLPEESFRQCHRSYIINLDRVSEFNKSSVMIGSAEIPISASYKKDIKALLSGR